MRVVKKRIRRTGGKNAAAEKSAAAFLIIGLIFKDFIHKIGKVFRLVLY